MIGDYLLFDNISGRFIGPKGGTVISPFYARRFEQKITALRFSEKHYQGQCKDVQIMRLETVHQF